MTKPFPAPSHLLWLALISSGTQAQSLQDLQDMVAKLPYGNGFSASTLCTRVNASSDDFAKTRDRFVAPLTEPLPKIWGITHWPGSFTSVSALIPFFTNTRVAVYRKGLGCTIVPPGNGYSISGLLAQSWHLATPQPATTLPWPAGEGPAQVEGLSDAARVALNAAGADLMAEKPDGTLNEAQNTIAVLVAQDGKLIYEQYGSGYNKDQPQLGHSMTKALTTLMAGRMITEGYFGLDDKPPVPELNTGDKNAITWRHLLTASSGLLWTEGYTSPTTMARMLYDQGNQGAFAASQPVLHAPGAVFTYSTGSYGIAAYGMRKILGDSAQASYDYYQTQLFAPLGIRNGVIEVDMIGTPIGGSRGVLRARDWLKLGQLILNGGQWMGQQLVRSDYIDFMRTRTPAPVNESGEVPAYGAGLCLRRPDSAAAVPSDLVWLCGSFGQELMLVPSRRLAVLRLGASMPRADTHQRMLNAVTQLSQALP